MKEPKQLGFVVQEILLNEAQTLVSAGDGKYSDLLIILSSALPEIEKKNSEAGPEEKKGFAFGLPGGKELEEKERRALCHQINLRLKRTGIHWSIHYSGNRKLFVCVPTITDPVQKVFLPRVGRRHHGFEEKRQQILTLKQAGFSYRQIAQKLGISQSTVDYRLRGDRKSPYVEKVSAVPQSSSALTPQEFVEMARYIFNFQEPFSRTFAQRPIKVAISVVGIKDLKLKDRALSSLLGFKKGAAAFNAYHAKVGPEVQILRDALKQKGVIR